MARPGTRLDGTTETRLDGKNSSPRRHLHRQREALARLLTSLYSPTSLPPPRAPPPCAPPPYAPPPYAPPPYAPPPRVPPPRASPPQAQSSGKRRRSQA